jgi:hypothetical protein
MGISLGMSLSDYACPISIFIHLNGRYHLQLASWIIWSFLASHHPDLRLAWELQRSSFPTVTKPSPSCLLSLVKRSETCLQVHRILGGIILEDSMVGTPVPAVTQSFNHKFAIYSSWPSYATQSSVNLVHILDCFLFILWWSELAMYFKLSWHWMMSQRTLSIMSRIFQIDIFRTITWLRSMVNMGRRRGMDLEARTCFRATCSCRSNHHDSRRNCWPSQQQSTREGLKV